MCDEKSILGAPTILYFGVAGMIRVAIEPPSIDGVVRFIIDFDDVLILHVEGCSNAEVLCLVEVGEYLSDGLESGL